MSAVNAGAAAAIAEHKHCQSLTVFQRKRHKKNRGRRHCDRDAVTHCPGFFNRFFPFWLVSSGNFKATPIISMAIKAFAPETTSENVITGAGS